MDAEHLLDFFTSIDTNSENVWDFCAYYTKHPYLDKPQLVMLGPKIEVLSDDSPSKVQYLLRLSYLSESVGNQAERKQFLTHFLKLWESGVMTFVLFVYRAIYPIQIYMRASARKGYNGAREGSEVFERLDHTANQVEGFGPPRIIVVTTNNSTPQKKPHLMRINLLPEKREEYLVPEVTAFTNPRATQGRPFTILR